MKEILPQYILDKFFQLTLKFHNDVLCPKIEESSDDDISPLEKAEEQTIRYVAGYILCSVRNSVQNKKSSHGVAILKILSCWGSKSSWDFEPSSFLNYTKEWVEKVNSVAAYLLLMIISIFLSDTLRSGQGNFEPEFHDFIFSKNHETESVWKIKWKQFD